MYIDRLPLLWYTLGMKTWHLALITFTATILVASAVVGVVFALLVHNENTAQGTISYDAVEEPRKKEEPKSKYEVGPPDATEILELVNNERAKVGVAPLTVDERLVGSAQRKADLIVKDGKYDHDNGDGTRGYQYALEATKGECSYASENLKAHDIKTADSKSILDGWMNSESHRNALLDAKYASTGVALANDGYRVFIVQHFCQP